jgi:tRNA 2-selenouridine synthase
MTIAMSIILTSLDPLKTFGFDDIIDVRSPAEFAEDHLPGAINLPVLTDAERAEVGTIYKQDSPFRARKIGAALVAANAARHLQGPLADKPGNWRPLVYCWRGGQRSGSFASILSQIGWRVELISGGYKAWRGLVVDSLYTQPFPGPVIVLDGNTGSAKTALLGHMADAGLQVLDLEGLAHHRGSLFGAMPGGQPSQKMFERNLAMAMAALDPARPVVVEAESSKVGNCRLPPGLWKAMAAAPRVIIDASVEARADYLVTAYSDLATDQTRLHRVIDLLASQHDAKVIEGWHVMATEGAFTTLAADLMARHYDPRYEKHRQRLAADRDEADAPYEFPTANLSEGAQRTIANRMAGTIEQLYPGAASRTVSRPD